MEIKVNLEELKKKSIFLAIPAYGGMVTGITMKSVLDLQTICTQYGIELRVSMIFNESLVQRARNYLADEFMCRSTCTNFFFVDSDVGFDAKDVITMLALDKDIIGGLYPKKSIGWEQLKKAIDKNPDLPASEYAKLTGEMVFNPIAGTEKFNVSELVEVAELGTGFLMIKREAFEAFDVAFPEYKYRPDHVSTNFFDGSRQISAYFNVEINEVSNRLESEDFWFCRKMRELGVKIYMCPWIQLIHMGSYQFQGSLPSVAQHIGSL